MRELDHPGVQKIYQFYPNDLVYYYTVLEFLEGAELFDLICEKVRKKTGQNSSS